MSTEFVSSAPVEYNQPYAVSERAPNTETRIKIGRAAAAGLLTLTGAVMTFAAEEAVQSSPAAAYSTSTGDYPWQDATVLNAATSDYGYSTCPDSAPNCKTKTIVKNNITYGVYDPWNYYFRNCTSYTAWRLSAEFGVSASGLGNATMWNNNAPNKGWTVDHTPEVGDIAHFEGNDNDQYNHPGHVAFVEEIGTGVNAGKVRVAEYNQGLNGNFRYDRWVQASNYIDVNGANPSGFTLKLSAGGGSTPPPSGNIQSVSGKADFNNDNKSDFVTREGDMWTVKTGGGIAIAQGVHLGNANAIPLVGDVNGDHYSDFITYDNGAWMAWDGRSPYGIASQGVQLGGANTIPLVGDVNGDGRADFVTFEGGQWNAKSASGIAISLGVWRGPNTAKPLLGDMNNDGRSDFVTYDNGTWAGWNATGSNDVIFQGVQFGNTTATPMVGNVDGADGSDLIFRDGNSWYAAKTNSTPISLGVVRGSTTSVPFVSDIGGNSQADFVTFEKSNGAWYAWDATGSNNLVSQGVSFGSGGVGVTG